MVDEYQNLTICRAQRQSTMDYPPAKANVNKMLNELE